MKTKDKKINSIDDIMVCYGSKIYYKKSNLKQISLKDSLDRIKTGANQKQVELIRDYKGKGLIEEHIKAKQECRYTIFQGEFNEKNNKSLTQPSGLAVLDFDSVEDPIGLKEILFDSVPFLLAAWISPSGDGVKALVKIPYVDDDKAYKRLYNALLNVFEDHKPDKNNKDISRACFDSYDPYILVKEWEDVEIFDAEDIIQKQNSEQNEDQIKVEGVELDFNFLFNSPPPEGVSKDNNKKFQFLINRIEKSGNLYSEGNRNNFVFMLTMDCIKNGIHKEAASKLILQYLEGDLPTNEIERTFEKTWERDYSTKIWDTENLIEIRKSFIFYESFTEVLRKMNLEDAYNLVLAMSDYAIYHKQPELTSIPDMAFTLIKPQLDANEDKRQKGAKGSLINQAKKRKEK